MSHHKVRLFIVPVLISLVVLLGACDNSTPNPQKPPYVPGCSVQNLIGHIDYANSSNDPDVIILDPGCVYTLEVINNTTSADAKTVYSGLPIIISPITIYGNDAVIDVQPAENVTVFGHFFIDPIGDLELYNLSLVNGSRPLGGSVINIGGDFFVSNVTFINNKAFYSGPGTDARGGAIYNNSGRVRVLDSCHFEQNWAGHLNSTADDQGGAIYSENGTLVVSSSTFLNNIAAGSGGAIFTRKSATDESGGLITINESEFIDNHTLQDGGAAAFIDETNGVSIVRSLFTQNFAGGKGGAVFSKGTELIGTENRFILNTGTYGGAVYTQLPGEGSQSSYTSVSTTFDQNHADTGGGVYSENSELVLDGSNFSENNAFSCAGLRIGGSLELDVMAGDLSTAIRIPSNSSIIGSDFLHNTASLASGGGACHVMGNLTIQDSFFYENSAPHAGGGMIIYDKADFTGVAFVGNSAEVGGGLTIGYPLLYFTEEDWVSPIYMTFHTSILGSRFSANEAAIGGGGIYAHHRGSVEISKSYFQGNTSIMGGGLRLVEGDTYIMNSTFAGNNAVKGGGIYAHGSVPSNPVLTITHATFAYNNATETSNGGDVTNRRWGGGGLNVGGTATVENSLFAYNTSMDCQLDNGMNYSAPGTYGMDHTCAGQIELNPKLGPFLDNGGGTRTFALLHDSPLIDVLSNCVLSNDQRSVQRPKGASCDPGAYEFDPDNPTDPQSGLDGYQPVSLEPNDSSDNCPPFEDLDISVVLLNVPADTLVLPLYFRFPGSVPGQDEAEFKAQLGNIESNKCDQQGFEDRLYCMFNLTPDMLGMALDLTLYEDDCEDKAYFLPNVSIPELKGSSSGPKTQCSEDLGEDACVAAGGEMSTGGVEAPHCDCP